MTNSNPAASGMTVREYAINMAARGYPVYPTRLVRREDGKKEPTIPVGWRDQVSTDPAQIDAWFKPGTRYNAYLIDCEKARIVVVDLDRGTHTDKITGEVIHRDGVAEWARIGGPQALMVVRTASGGEHHYFAATDEWAHSLGSNKAGLGIDVQGAGKCVFGPGSEVAPHDDAGETTRYTFVTKALRREQLSSMPVSVVERGMAERAEQRATERKSRASARAYDVPADGTAATQASARVTQAWEQLAACVHGGGFNDALNELCYEVGRWAGAQGWEADQAEAYIIETMAAHPVIGEADANDLTTIGSTGIRNGLENPWEVNQEYREVDDIIDSDPGEAPAGSQPAAGALEDLADALIAEMLDTDQIKALPPPRYLMQKLLVQDSLAQIYGASGSFKTFGVLGMAAAVGEGSDWQGYECQQGDVVYIAAEGSAGISKRVRAWEKHHGRPMRGVRVLPRAVQLGEAEARVLVAAVEKLQPALVIVDTQARSTVGVDENSNWEMGKVLHMLNGMRQVSKACVMLVHHTGKDADGPDRGASAIRAGIDTQIEFRRDKRTENVTVNVTKQKDGEEVTGIPLELAALELDRLELDDPDETPTSCVLVTRKAEAQRGLETDEGVPLLWDIFNPPSIGVLADKSRLTGEGAAAIPDLARYMATEALKENSIGISRTDAMKAFAKAEKHSDTAVRRAWGRLHRAGALEPEPGQGATGRSVWTGPLERFPDGWT